jgi:hypothetical protein
VAVWGVTVNEFGNNVLAGFLQEHIVGGKGRDVFLK